MVLLGIIILTGAYAFGLGPFNSSKTPDTSSDDPSLTDRGVNLNPPTDKEKNETETHKDELVEGSSGGSSDSNKKAVEPLITRADQTEVRAYVPGVVENGGTCTATLSKGSAVIVKTSEGVANSSVTNCRPINLAGTQFPQKGQWSLTVSYSSDTAAGKSQPTTVEVQ